MATEKRVSETASATMKTWVDLNRRFRNPMTTMTRMLATTDIKTKIAEMIVVPKERKGS